MTEASVPRLNSAIFWPAGIKAGTLARAFVLSEPMRFARAKCVRTGGEGGGDYTPSAANWPDSSAPEWPAGSWPGSVRLGIGGVGSGGGAVSG